MAQWLRYPLYVETKEALHGKYIHKFYHVDYYISVGGGRAFCFKTTGIVPRTTYQ
jgi:hypothetical protein